MAELVDAADSKSVFERSGSSSLPRGTKIQEKPTFLGRFFCGWGLVVVQILRIPVGTRLPANASESPHRLMASRPLAHSSNVIDTGVTLYILALEDCNCAYVGTGYQQIPPAFLAAEKAGFSEGSDDGHCPSDSEPKVVRPGAKGSLRLLLKNLKGAHVAPFYFSARSKSAGPSSVLRDRGICPTSVPCARRCGYQVTT